MRARSSRACSSVTSISGFRPHSGASAAIAACTSTRGSPERIVSGCRSEEHTSELQSRENLVCRLLLEKKKKKKKETLKKISTIHSIYANRHHLTIAYCG